MARVKVKGSGVHSCTPQRFYAERLAWYCWPWGDSPGAIWYLGRLRKRTYHEMVGELYWYAIMLRLRMIERLVARGADVAEGQ